MKNDIYFLTLIFSISVILGSIYAVKTGQFPTPAGKVGDAMQYSNIAENISTGVGYSTGDPPVPTSIRAPLYPFFISVIYMLFGVNYIAVKVAQAIVLGLMCITVYMITKEMYSNIPLSRLSGLIASVYPFFIYYSGFLLVETLYTFFLSLTVFFLIKGASDNKNKLLFFTGILLGLTALISPRILTLPAFIFLWFILLTSNLRTALMRFIIVIIALIITLTPWTIRNYSLHKRFVLISTHGGRTLLSGLSPTYKNERIRPWGSVAEHWEEFWEETKELNAEGIYKADDVSDRVGFKKAITLFLKDPLSFIRNIPVKMSEFWKLWPGEGGPYDTFFFKLLWLFSMDALLVFGLIGFVYAMGAKDRPSLLLLFVILNTNLVHLVFTARHRYQTTIMPYIIILAAYGIYRIWCRFIMSEEIVGGRS